MEEGDACLRVILVEESKDDVRFAPTNTNTALAFLQTCDGGKGWDACLEFCRDGAGFTSQAEPLTECTDLKSYAEWMRGVAAALPDARVTLGAVTSNNTADTVMICATYAGTHTGELGPLPPTGKATITDFVYVLRFSDRKIVHVTKVGNANWTMRELGWM